jgi:spore coat polysaccharide biosynthesis protein SpsF (cytidylyltransferase family)
LLELTIERLKRIKKVRHIIIATTKLKTDNKIDTKRRLQREEV